MFLLDLQYGKFKLNVSLAEPNKIIPHPAKLLAYNGSHGTNCEILVALKD